MYLFSRLFQAARAWRNSGRPKTAKRSAVDVEQLDHRRLLSVNFSGNVATDFPTTSPGVVIFNSSNTPGIITPDTSFYGSLIPTSGYAISGIAVSYDSTDDTLSIGFEQPPANTPSNPTGPVIAGDADDNGNAGNVNPAVLALDPFFTEFPALSGQDIEMYSFLDLGNTGTPDVVAGFSPNQAPLPPNMSPSPSPNPVSPKPYEVAQAIPTIIPDTGPGFGTLLANNTGNYLSRNSRPRTPTSSSRSRISRSSIRQETGHALTPSSVIGIGAFARQCSSTAHIGDAYFPENTFTLAQATVPVTPGQSPAFAADPDQSS